MSDTPRYVKEVQRILADLDTGDNQEKQPPATDTPENVIDLYIEDFAEEERITLIRKKPPLPTTSDDERDLPDRATAPRQPQPAFDTRSGMPFFQLFIILLCLLCIAVQVNFIVHPFSVTVSLEARSQQITAQGTLQLGRVLNPITISQSSSVQATGHGHQDARNATGSVTFYNGLFSEQTVPAGTILTGSDGVQVVTTQDGIIPAATANPLAFGQVTVAAQATSTGSKENIATYDINETCCASGILVKNTAPFQGGKDARDYTYVTKSDISNAADPLQATVSQSVQAALQAQLKQGEELQTLPCGPTIHSNYQVGDEASQVTVTASETCSAIAYNDQELTDSVTQLLTTQAAKKAGSGYGLLDTPQITITGATPGKHVTLSFRAMSTWVYGINSAQQRYMKNIIAGKNTQEALKVLRSLPGIESASVAFSGFGDSSRIPKDTANIYILLFVA